ncbi:MAG: helix-hairpin-helix domain-containing protein [Acidimicrobiia bacterium]
MKRLARILGLLGGIGAVAWAMRERFVSVAISREPVPPAFKVPDPVVMSPVEAKSATEITSVSGIGPVYATRLESIGVSTIEGLATSRAEQVAAAAEVPLSRAVGWIEAARGMTNQP